MEEKGGGGGGVWRAFSPPLAFPKPMGEGHEAATRPTEECRGKIRWAAMDDVAEEKKEEDQATVRRECVWLIPVEEEEEGEAE